MKIAIFTDTFLPRIDGIVSSVCQLAGELAKQGHQILIVAPHAKGSEKIKLPGIELVYISSLPAIVYPDFRLGLLSPGLILKLKHFSPDIIHISTPLTIGLTGLVYAKVFDLPAVGVFHAYFAEQEYLETFGIKRGMQTMQRFLWRIARDFYDRCDLIITPSKFVAKDLKKHDIKKPVKVISNALALGDLASVAAHRQFFVRKYQLAQAEVVLYVGRLSQEKDLLTLLEAFNLVVKKKPTACLLLVGDGPQKQQLMQKVNSLGIKKQVIFVGLLDHEVLLQSGLYNLARVFVTCSHSEVQPMSLIEAISFGLPLVVAKSKGVTEMVSGNGFLVEPQNPGEFAARILEILNQPKLQQKFADRSKKLAAKYDLQTITGEHLKVYCQLIKNHRCQ